MKRILLILAVGLAGPLQAQGQALPVRAQCVCDAAVQPAYHVDVANIHLSDSDIGTAWKTDWDIMPGYGLGATVAYLPTQTGEAMFSFPLPASDTTWTAAVRMRMDFTNLLAGSQITFFVPWHSDSMAIVLQRHSDGALIAVGSQKGTSTMMGGTGWPAATYNSPSLKVGDYTLYVFVTSAYALGRGTPTVAVARWMEPYWAFKQS